MSGNTFNFLFLLAALLVGYGVYTSTMQREPNAVVAAPTVQGYYLKNAVISETTDSGAPLLRVAANNVQQNLTDNSVAMQTVKIDYLAKPTGDMPATHWEMTASEGELPAHSQSVTLTGDVVAHTIDAARPITLKTPALTIDTQKQTAHSTEPVTINVAGREVTGHGLNADLPHQRLQLGGSGELKVAEAPSQRDKISLPDIFEHEGLELRDGGIRLTKVNSKTEPLVQANEATASSTDLDNNRFTLRGDVRLDLPQQGSLRADTAVVTVRGGQIIHAIASGRPSEPVQFEHERTVFDKQTNENKVENARGHADTIDYDVPNGMLTFKGDVWFSTGRFDWRGEDWQYNLIDGSGSTTHRSTTTVHPRSADTPKKP